MQKRDARLPPTLKNSKVIESRLERLKKPAGLPIGKSTEGAPEQQSGGGGAAEKQTMASSAATGLPPKTRGVTSGQSQRVGKPGAAINGAKIRVDTAGSQRASDKNLVPGGRSLVSQVTRASGDKVAHRMN